MKAAIYIRVSTVEQATEGYSIVLKLTVLKPIVCLRDGILSRYTLMMGIVQKIRTGLI
ncbi:DNA invertase Pin-like site-specific DNA recombinase [Bacillus pakistanensis]|uniref:DNA invertase Pin-like site-specific DNA recombinase n=1 Tax=Rossellomorea pakistanensis TaxID=992288 RepID=A0ABS2NA31_9BACI|nr:DNA invertase Pin-like site-specific DNA recombinase [Bacillus pakistanensis]